MKSIRSHYLPSDLRGRSPEVQALARIGAELRATYDASLDDPMTRRLMELIRQLAANGQQEENKREDPASIPPRIDKRRNGRKSASGSR